MTTTLLTGATGFIGAHALRLLEAAGDEVHAVSSNAPVPATASRAVWHRCDLLDVAAVQALVRRVKPQRLLHFAWYAVPGKYWKAPENLDWVRSSISLLRAFADAGGRRVVAAGTCAEYDWADGNCVENSTALKPRALYGVCKAAWRDVLAGYSAECGLSSAWGRIFFLYGPGEPAARLVSSVARALLKGEEAKTSQGEQQRDFLHVADVAAGFVALLNSEVQGPVNIASGQAVRVREVVETLADIVGRRELLKLGALAATDELPLVVGDNRRLSREVSWAPRFGLRAGLEDTVAWWRSVL